jgi:hypothetical protein
MNYIDSLALELDTIAAAKPLEELQRDHNFLTLAFLIIVDDVNDTNGNLEENNMILSWQLIDLRLVSVSLQIKTDADKWEDLDTCDLQGFCYRYFKSSRAEARAVKQTEENL